jgi:hypothetical protein
MILSVVVRLLHEGDVPSYQRLSRVLHEVDFQWKQFNNTSAIMSSGKYVFRAGLKELRFHLCQTSDHSAATRYATTPLQVVAAERAWLVSHIARRKPCSHDQRDTEGQKAQWTDMLLLNQILPCPRLSNNESQEPSNTNHDPRSHGCRAESVGTL